MAGERDENKALTHIDPSSPLSGQIAFPRSGHLIAVLGPVIMSALLDDPVSPLRRKLLAKAALHSACSAMLWDGRVAGMNPVSPAAQDVGAWSKRTIAVSSKRLSAADYLEPCLAIEASLIRDRCTRSRLPLVVRPNLRVLFLAAGIRKCPTRHSWRYPIARSCR
jgi:hypothetical protein